MIALITKPKNFIIDDFPETLELLDVHGEYVKFEEPVKLVKTVKKSSIINYNSEIIKGTIYLPVYLYPVISNYIKIMSKYEGFNTKYFFNMTIGNTYIHNVIIYDVFHRLNHLNISFKCSNIKYLKN